MGDERIFKLHADMALARAGAEWAFARLAGSLRDIFPASAEIRHVGATAIPGCLTKGDLDVVVRVAPEDFAQAEAALAERFARNNGSDLTEAFAAFEDPSASPHVGIQLTAVGGACDDFHLFADALQRDPALVARYNALKLKFDAQAMDDYRAAKSLFIAGVLGGRNDEGA